MERAWLFYGTGICVIHKKASQNLHTHTHDPLCHHSPSRHGFLCFNAQCFHSPKTIPRNHPSSRQQANVRSVNTELRELTDLRIDQGKNDIRSRKLFYEEVYYFCQKYIIFFLQFVKNIFKNTFCIFVRKNLLYEIRLLLLDYGICTHTHVIFRSERVHAFELIARLYIYIYISEGRQPHIFIVIF